MRHRLLLFPLVLLWGAWNPFMRQVPEVRRANERLKGKDYPAAETGFKAALERRASEPKLKYNLGLTYLGQNNYAAAEAEFISATSSDSVQVRARGNFFLGVTRFHLAETLQQPEEKIGKYKEAADNFRRVLEIEPDNEEARHNLEMALERIEDVEKDQEEQKKQQEQKEKQQQDQKDQKDQKDQDQQNKDQQNKDQQNKDQQNKDQQNKDQQNKDQQNKDQQNKDQQNQDQQNKDQQNKDQQNKDQQNKDQQNKDQQNKDQQNKDQQNKDQQNQDQQNKDQQNKDSQNPDPQQQPQGKPESPEVKAAKRALDDLKERQKQRILEMHRKGGQGRRAPIKDW